MLKLEKGLTLLEVIIVLLLFAIVATFGVPSYRNSQERIDETEGKNNLENIYAGMDNYFVRNNGYPPSDMAEVDDINSTLNMGIVEQNMDYDCTSSAGTFTCTAVSNYGWELDVSDTSSQGNPRCSSGTCPTCAGGGC